MPDDLLLPVTRLGLEMPPRHGKSEHVSRYFAAWYLGRHPSHHLILASYGDNYSASWGRRARNVLERWGPEAFGVAVDQRLRSAHEWELAGFEGGMLAAGTGGAITGRGANGILIDDPIKGAQEASSVVMQERVWDWWQSEAITRLEVDDAGLEPIVVIVQTRWNEADLMGRILTAEEDTEDEETWYVLRLPALAEENDPLGRDPGEALWPERRSLEFLQRVKERIGSYWWSALYQQRPAPLAGNVFPRGAWQMHDGIPEGYHPGGTFVDTAGYDTDVPGDFWAFASVVRVQKDLYWDNAKHGRWSFSQAKQELLDERARSGLPIYIEKTALSIPLIQELQREIEGVIAIEVHSAKENRALAAQPNLEAGNFYLPRGARWVSDFIEEHALFPNGAHDDWVDTTSLANWRLYGVNVRSVDASERQRYGARRRQGWVKL